MAGNGDILQALTVRAFLLGLLGDIGNALDSDGFAPVGDKPLIRVQSVEKTGRLEDKIACPICKAPPKLNRLGRGKISVDTPESVPKSYRHRAQTGKSMVAE
jgi:hypothetical protein